MGWIGRAYKWWWSNGPALFDTDEPYTFIMRRNGYLLLVPAFMIMILEIILLPHSWWARLTLWGSTGGLFFLMGHVLWGGTQRWVSQPGHQLKIPGFKRGNKDHKA